MTQARAALSTDTIILDLELETKATQANNKAKKPILLYFMWLAGLDEADFRDETPDQYLNNSQKLFPSERCRITVIHLHITAKPRHF